MSTWGWPELTTLFLHFVSLSLLSVGGAITTVPEMHRFLVTDQAWLAEDQFSTSIALAQAAPGPNVLFVAVLGWTVGMNAAGGPSAGASAWAFASACVFASMMGILLPSATLTYFASRWGQRNRELPTVRAFRLAMAPIVVGLLVATGWILTAGHGHWASHPGPYALSLAATLMVWRSRIHLLWLLGAGALAGAIGWI